MSGDEGGNMNEADGRNIIKLRGLPWNSTANDIMDFLKDCQVVEGDKGVHLAISHRDGRPNGEAFVELASPEDVDKAFEYNKNVLGHRYIEIFNAKYEEFEMCIKRQNLVQQDTFIKLRGLPFSCKSDDIENFFQGLEIRNGTNGIYIVFDSRGRPTGEAFVQFCNSEDTDLAMKKNREKIGHRYIEIFRSSSSECRRSTIFNNGGRNGGGGGGGGNMNFGNDRRGGGGMRNNRSNFRDRPYPDTPWNQGGNNNNSNDMPWRNNRNNNFGGNNGGGFGNNPSNGGNSMFNDNNFSSDFERNWNSGGNNSYNSFSGGNGNGNGSGNGSQKGNSSFDRDFTGFNNFSNNSNGSGNGSGNFGNDRFNGGGGGGGSGGNMNSSGGQYAVHLRGMPYDCGESEIMQFFSPLKLVNCEVLYNNNGRHTGEADAYFTNIADAQEAMKKHKEKMGSRYIELFAKSNERRGGGGGGGGGGRF